MLSLHSRTTGALALAGCLLLTGAPSRADVLDFESPELTGLYLPGESLVQAGFVLTQRLDAGTVDVGAGLGSAAPTNNVSTFYTSLNDGFLTLSRTDGLGFSLQGFDAAYVPQLQAPNDAETVLLVALATTLGGQRYSTYFEIGNTASNSGGSAFITFASGVDFSLFQSLASVDFFTCLVDAGPICRAPTLNNAQFALDNIAVSVVPEPSAYALMALGLAGLGIASRRCRRDDSL